MPSIKNSAPTWSQWYSAQTWARISTKSKPSNLQYECPRNTGTMYSSINQPNIPERIRPSFLPWSQNNPFSMEKIRIMELLLHSADLSNCVKVSFKMNKSKMRVITSPGNFTQSQQRCYWKNFSARETSKRQMIFPSVSCATELLQMSQRVK